MKIVGRGINKSNDGVSVCCLCPESTRLQQVVILYDLTKPLFECHVRRAHVSCLKDELAEGMRRLKESLAYGTDGWQTNWVDCMFVQSNITIPVISRHKDIGLCKLCVGTITTRDIIVVTHNPEEKLESQRSRRAHLTCFEKDIQAALAVMTAPIIGVPRTIILQ